MRRCMSTMGKALVGALRGNRAIPAVGALGDSTQSDQTRPDWYACAVAAARVETFSLLKMLLT